MTDLADIHDIVEHLRKHTLGGAHDEEQVVDALVRVMDRRPDLRKLLKPADVAYLRAKQGTKGRYSFDEVDEPEEREPVEVVTHEPPIDRAAHYARDWNDLRAAGRNVSRDEITAAASDLAGTGVYVAWNASDDAPGWEVVPAPVVDAVMGRYARDGEPGGGVMFGGEVHRGQYNAWKESEHPRGQPENAGEFAPTSGTASTEKKDTVESQSTVDNAETARQDYAKNGTRAKAFKDWFGDWESDPENASKVVDDDGTPKETYEVKKLFHGTTADFDAFDAEKMGANGAQVGTGFYFAENEEIAKNYAQGSGKVLSVYLKIGNPYDFDGVYSPKRMEQWAAAAMEVAPHKFNPEIFAEEIRSKQKWEKSADGNLSGYSAYHALANSIGMRYVNKVLAKVGFDGILHESRDGHGTPKSPKEKASYGRVWIAFEPTQIKAVDNMGTFNPADPRMQYAREAIDTVRQ